MAKILESGEDYLETILTLHNRMGYVRSIDVVNETGYSKPSVSRAMKSLKEKEMITIEPGGMPVRLNMIYATKPMKS